jgi:hypothetical protein
MDINIIDVRNVLSSYLKKKAEYETNYHIYITKKTNIENILKYTNEIEDDLIEPYTKYLDNQLTILKDLHTEYNNVQNKIFNLKNELKSNIVILTDLLNEIENNLQNKSNINISNLDGLQINSNEPINHIDAFEKNEYSSVYNNNLLFYWEGPFGVLVPNHIDQVQSIYSNIYLTKEGQLIVKDSIIKEAIFVYDKETYLDNFTNNNNGQYIYNI